MGLFKKSSWSSYDKLPQTKIVTVEVTKPLPNPNPTNYKIIRYEEIGCFLILEVKYLDCTNYEGHKIMMYMGCSIKDIIKQESIDPHFSDNPDYHSPKARFEPTIRGWEMCKLLVYSIQEITK